MCIKYSYFRDYVDRSLIRKEKNMASWSKVKQQLESFLCPELVGRVEYRATSYRYAHDKAGRCYITVDKKEVFQMSDLKYDIRWYQTEQEIIKDQAFHISITEEEVEEFLGRKEAKNIPKDRIAVILQRGKASEVAKKILNQQGIMAKSDFFDTANIFLISPVDASLQSDNILLNILAIVDRRVGKSRLRKMEQQIQLKHPIVQYFYSLRCNMKK